MRLSFTIAAGLRQRSHSQARVSRDSWPHFTVLDSRLPQPGGPGPRIYIRQEQGGPVISPGTGFTFRRLLRLVGIRWRYSTPPPHGIEVVNLTVFKTTARHGPHRKHRFYIVARLFVFAGMCLPSRCLETGCIKPLFYYCVSISCGRYLTTAAVYRVTA
jgi:hypothetical protein